MRLNRMLNRGALLAALWVLAGGVPGAPAQAAPAGTPAPLIVMVDMHQLVYDSKAGKGVQTQMEKERQAFSKEVAAEEDALQKARADLERQRGAMAPEQAEAKGREFQQRVEELDRNVQSRQRAWQQVFNDAMGKVEEQALK